MVNKVLMANHGFGFGKINLNLYSICDFLDKVMTLPGIHYAITALATLVLKSLGYLERFDLPLLELMNIGVDFRTVYKYLTQVSFPSPILRFIVLWPYFLGVHPSPSKEVFHSAFNLLGHMAPAQAMSLLLVGPFVDLWLTNNRVDTYSYNNVVMVSDVQYFNLD
ncbi:hypothetical protein HU200_032461 [Digitaria exilis]|uniref:Uncharacterized protein n=1 Tax=Digitaria exilis TaxID=1010633 RepID=A0A835BKU9_9POAL|nr:hypothetical protein HU200_032461 [Digitaria exilis]